MKAERINENERSVYMSRMSRLLTVVADSDRLELALRDASRRAVLVDGRDFMTLSDLIELCARSATPRKRLASPMLVETLALRLLKHAAFEALGPKRSTPAMAREVVQLLSGLRAQNATAQQLRDAAGQLSGFGRTRGLALASLWEQLDETIAQRGFLDASALGGIAAQELLRVGVPAALKGFDEICVQGVTNFPAGVITFLEGLSKVLRDGKRLVIRWPGTGVSSVDVAISQAIRRFEQQWASETLELELETGEGPHRHLAPLVFADDDVSAPVPEGLSVFSAANERDESNEIARRARTLIQRGVSPDDIAVCVRGVADDVHAFETAFAQAGLSLRAPRRVVLAETPRGALFLAALELHDLHFPADELARVITAPCLRDPFRFEGPAQALFRLVGLRDSAFHAQGDRTAYDVRLGAQRDRLKAGDANDPRARALWVRLLESVSATIELLSSLPDSARWTAFANETVRIGRELGLLSAARSLEWVDVQALEYASVQSMLSLCELLPRVLHDAGLENEVVSRAEFLRWLRHQFAQRTVLLKSPRVASVSLVDVASLAGRTWKHVFVARLSDGRFPSRPVPSSVLSDDVQVQLNQAAKQPLFRVQAMEGDIRLPLAAAEERLWFHLALSAATETTTLSAPRHHEGRERLRSPFLNALHRVLPELVEERLTQLPVPLLANALSETDVRARVALEAHCPPETRQTQDDVLAASVTTLVKHEPWFVDAQSLGAIETERLRYFSNEHLPAGRWSGQLSGPALDQVARALSADERYPLSASMLTQLSNCGFEGLVRRVLRAGAEEASTDDLNPKTGGTLLHDVLRHLVPVLIEKDLLSEHADPARVQHEVHVAMERAAAEVFESDDPAHPTIWPVALERLERALCRTIATGVLVTMPSVTFRGTEVQFGREDAREELRAIRIPAAFPGERDVFITGAFDRLDVSDEQVGVLDYKAGRLPRKFEAVEALLEPDFQLPLYAYAARTAFPGKRVDARLIGLRLGEVLELEALLGKDSTLERLLAVDEKTRADARAADEKNLANAVHDLLGRRRAGDFGARPKDCKWCDLRSVCRISARHLAEEFGS